MIKFLKISLISDDNTFFSPREQFTVIRGEAKLFSTNETLYNDKNDLIKPKLSQLTNHLAKLPKVMLDQ